jgi:hypothetical protein
MTSADYLLLYFIFFGLIITVVLLFITNKDIIKKEIKIGEVINTKYITDLKILNFGQTCESGYETNLFGKWSGFSGNDYICKNKFINELIVKEKSKEDDVTYNCNKLNSVETVPIESFKGKKFCVKRSQDTLANLLAEVKPFDSMTEYYNGLLISNLSIDKDAITDIKIVDNTHMSFIPHGYELIYGEDFNVYIKRFGKTSANIIEANNLFNNRYSN